ncbi:unnamed protein product [Pleuronectes platessa]|uniref:Uncharacterized protein n=1 Tax=Pleuronectes platessa TaxID=8262 RepID=A0A9N7UUH4_PLEPL|nr:unnamed protein product [Pleuronectes platessa]
MWAHRRAPRHQQVAWESGAAFTALLVCKQSAERKPTPTTGCCKHQHPPQRREEKDGAKCRSCSGSQGQAGGMGDTALNNDPVNQRSVTCQLQLSSNRRDCLEAARTTVADVQKYTFTPPLAILRGNVHHEPRGTGQTRE